MFLEIQPTRLLPLGQLCPSRCGPDIVASQTRKIMGLHELSIQLEITILRLADKSLAFHNGGGIENLIGHFLDVVNSHKFTYRQ